MSVKIKVDNLHAGYNGADVLSGISIELERSDFVGVIGPNGSGKTTLLRAMSRALPPSAGIVTLDGKDIYSIPARAFARQVAVVPQDTFIAFDFTVLEVALMGRSPRLGRLAVEGSKDVEIALQALARTGTADLKDRPIHALSGGERQRVMVARALAQEPEVILLDEPTSHLDISFQFEIMDLIRSLNAERGLTVLAVLHDLNLASEYCDRLVMLGQGTVRTAGSPEEVITASNILQVYGAEVWVRKHPTTHRPYIIAGVKPGSMAPAKGFDEPPRIHVVGGGGTAAPVLARLARRGFRVTCGVLSAGDADREVADALDIDYIGQPVFAQILPESQRRHLELIRAAGVVVLTDVPVGHGNLPNIEAVSDAARAGAKVVVLKPESIADRDFAEGRATRLVDEILSCGAQSAQSVEELLGHVERLAGPGQEQ